jgi:hypothetical protein
MHPGAIRMRIIAAAAHDGVSAIKRSTRFCEPSFVANSFIAGLQFRLNQHD